MDHTHQDEHRTEHVDSDADTEPFLDHDQDEELNTNVVLETENQFHGPLTRKRKRRLFERFLDPVFDSQQIE